jgi:hypothetical protein
MDIDSNIHKHVIFSILFKPFVLLAPKDLCILFKSFGLLPPKDFTLFDFPFFYYERTLSNLEEFEDTKWVIRILESVNQYRTDNIMTKRKSTKGQTTIYKTYT